MATIAYVRSLRSVDVIRQQHVSARKNSESRDTLHSVEPRFLLPTRYATQCCYLIEPRFHPTSRHRHERLLEPQSTRVENIALSHPRVFKSLEAF